MRDVFRTCAVMAAVAGLGACATAPQSSPLGEADRADVLALDLRLMQSQIVERDASVLSAAAPESFRVLAPGGVIENRAQAERGVNAWDVVGIEVTKQEAVLHDDVAIVTGRLDIDGTMQPIGRWGPLKYIATYQMADGEWRFLSRALTPCLDKPIELGLC